MPRQLYITTSSQCYDAVFGLGRFKEGSNRDAPGVNPPWWQWWDSFAPVSMRQMNQAVTNIWGVLVPDPDPEAEGGYKVFEVPSTPELLLTAPHTIDLWYQTFQQACHQLGIEPASLDDSPSNLVQWLCKEFHWRQLERKIRSFRGVIIPSNYDEMWRFSKLFVGKVQWETVDWDTVTWAQVWEYLMEILAAR